MKVAMQCRENVTTCTDSTGRIGRVGEAWEDSGIVSGFRSNTMQGDAPRAKSIARGEDPPLPGPLSPFLFRTL
jgi:hypothetical protein